ncbi:MAG: DUF262 domain-containing protein [Propionibacteriaceae bacterium]|jgi:hypothetical protein|nr:DUF262 domain-containing protein [Propionibacteriaceae bacterium]
MPEIHPLDDAAEEPTTIEDNVLDDVDPDEEVIPESAFNITSWGLDLDVRGIVSKLEDEDIIIPSFYPQFVPEDGDLQIQGFQREFVWKRPQMDKFIESLLLGLPVPGIFLVRQPNNRLLVLDGQQRLQTLKLYYDGLWRDKVYRLKGVDSRFSNLAYSELEQGDRRQLDLGVIHATILRQDDDDGYQDAIYSIFERLNTGGSVLRPQEIRVALYHGKLLDAIAKTSADPIWSNVYGTAPTRFKDHELILRVLAFYGNADGYQAPLKTFLNHFLKDHRDDSKTIEVLELFRRALGLSFDALGKSAFRRDRALNAAIFDSVMAALMQRLASGAEVLCQEDFRSKYRTLLADDDYMKSVTATTNHSSSVATRMKLAREAFQ